MQGQQINVQAERAVDTDAAVAEKGQSPEQNRSAHAQSRLGNSAIQERLGLAPAKSTDAVASAADADGKAAESAPQARPKEHYKIEIKAWIPHSKVVDPEEPMRASDWLETAENIFDALPGPAIADPEYEFHSSYRGDNHADYGGSFRVLSVIEFDWDGKSISNVTGAGDYGATHRDWNSKAWVETLFGDIPLGNWSGSDSERATQATSRTGSGNSFSLGISSANPLVLTWAPNINANLTGTIGPDGALSLSYSTDLFPSHGIKVSRNGKVVHNAITKDASGVNALGPVGALNVGARLLTQSNNGSKWLPGGGTTGKVRPK